MAGSLRFQVLLFERLSTLVSLVTIKLDEDSKYTLHHLLERFYPKSPDNNNARSTLLVFIQATSQMFGKVNHMVSSTQFTATANVYFIVSANNKLNSLNIRDTFLHLHDRCPLALKQTCGLSTVNCYLFRLNLYLCHNGQLLFPELQKLLRDHFDNVEVLDPLKCMESYMSRFHIQSTARLGSPSLTSPYTPPVIQSMNLQTLSAPSDKSFYSVPSSTPSLSFLRLDQQNNPDLSSEPRRNISANSIPMSVATPQPRLLPPLQSPLGRGTVKNSASSQVTSKGLDISNNNLTAQSADVSATYQPRNLPAGFELPPNPSNPSNPALDVDNSVKASSSILTKSIPPPPNSQSILASLNSLLPPHVAPSNTSATSPKGTTSPQLLPQPASFNSSTVTPPHSQLRRFSASSPTANIPSAITPSLAQPSPHPLTATARKADVNLMSTSDPTGSRKLPSAAKVPKAPTAFTFASVEPVIAAPIRGARQQTGQTPDSAVDASNRPQETAVTSDIIRTAVNPALPPLPVVFAYPDHDGILSALKDILQASFSDALILGMTRVIFPALSPRPLHVRGYPVVIREHARADLIVAIGQLSSEGMDDLKSLLRIVGIHGKVATIETLLPLTLPHYLSYLIPEMLKNKGPAIATLPTQIHMALQRLIADAFPSKLLRDNEGFSIKLRNMVAVAPDGESLVVQVEGFNTNEQVRIVVLGGPFYPKGSGMKDFGDENRNPLMELYQSMPTRVLVSRGLKRAKDPAPLASIVLVCSLGQSSNKIWEKDSIDDKTKCLSLRLRDLKSWSQIDVVIWFSQIAWIHGLLSAWRDKLVALRKYLEQRSFTAEMVFNPINFDIVEKGLRDECGFEVSHWLIIHQHLAEQQVFKPPPPPPNKSPEDIECEKLALQSQTVMKTGNCKQAIAILDKAYILIGKNPHISLETRGFVVGNLGVAHQSIGEFTSALKYHTEHMEMFPLNLDPAAHARTCANLGIVYQSMGNPLKAIEYHEKHLRISKSETKDIQAEGRAYCNIGISHQNLGNHSKAQEYHQKHLAIALSTCDKSGEGRAYANLGIVFQSTGQLEKAVRYHYQHLRICLEDTRDQRGESSASGNLGNAYHLLMEYDRAAVFHQRHFDMSSAEATFDRAAICKARANLGHAYLAQSRFDLALRQYHDQRDDFVSRHDTSGEFGALNNVTVAYWAQGNRLEAISFAYKALQCYSKMRAGMSDSNFEQRASIYFVLQHMLATLGRPDEALCVLENYRNLALSSAKVVPNMSYDVVNVSELVKVAKDTSSVIISYSVLRDEGLIYIWVLLPSAELPVFVAVPCSQIDALDELARAAVYGSMLHQATPEPEESDFDEALVAILGFVKPQVRSFLVDVCGWDTVAEPQVGIATLRAAPQELDKLLQVAQTTFQLDINRNDLQALFEDPLVELHRILIAPIARYLPANPNDNVVLILCNRLYNVPFAALRETSNPADSLIRKHTLSLALSVRHYSTVGNLSDPSLRQASRTSIVIDKPKHTAWFKGRSVPPMYSVGLSDLPILALQPSISKFGGEKALFANLRTTVQPLVKEPKAIFLSTQGCMDEIDGPTPFLCFASDASTDGVVGPDVLSRLRLQGTDMVVLGGLTNPGWGCSTATNSHTVKVGGFMSIVTALVTARASRVVFPQWRTSEAASSTFMRRMAEISMTQPELTAPQIVRAVVMEMMESGDRHLAQTMSWAGFICLQGHTNDAAVQVPRPLSPDSNASTVKRPKFDEPTPVNTIATVVN